VDNLCSYEACGRKLHARGLCATHNLQFERGEELRRISTPGPNRYQRLKEIVENPTIWCMALGPSYRRERLHGAMYVQGPFSNSMNAARVAWRMANDWEDPGELFVLHRCNVHWCVNPNHLYLGDHWQNMQDKVEAGNSLRGEKNPNSKYTAEFVREVKTIYRKMQDVNGGVMPPGGRTALAEKYGLDPMALSNLMNAGTWKGVV
jgi:hypothetical protein